MFCFFCITSMINNFSEVDENGKKKMKFGLNRFLHQTPQLCYRFLFLFTKYI